MKFLHCADLHLGCPGGGERMRAFTHMLAFCKSENFRQQKDSRNTFRFSAVKKLPRLQDSGFGSIASRIISLFF